jgi:hypothetical protein
MIKECKALGEADLAKLDYSGVITLAEELGVLDVAAGRESFARKGLVD